MDMAAVLKHLITQDVSLPALKLVWDNQIELECLDPCELPKVTPAHYIQENQMTTEERHQLLCRQQRKINCRQPEAEVVIEPPIIVFQGYKCGETHSFPISIRNISRNTQRVVLLMDEAYEFKFDESSQRVGKFPSGMCINATITFSPQTAVDDYYHKLIVSTNKSKVAVPIVAIGCKPLLNIPDCFILENVAVRHLTVKPITVLNVGKKTARFSLSVKGPFEVKPDQGIILPNHSFTFDLHYFPYKPIAEEGEIRIKFENDEEIYMYIKANSCNRCCIKLSSPDVRCEDTYVSLQTKTTFFIENDSEIKAKFQWKAIEDVETTGSFSSLNAENGRPLPVKKLYFADSLLSPEDLDEEETTNSLMNMLEKGPSETDFTCCNESSITKLATQEDGPFKDENFSIYPLFGEVMPRSKTQIHLIFSPKQSRFYDGAAYLDISGLEKRLPFRFYGRGLGPKFKFAFDILEVGSVTLGGSHSYELPLQNTSEITGSIACEGLVGVPSGMTMKVEPKSLDVFPCQYTAFYVNFSCIGQPGHFEDVIKFTARETGDVFYVTVKGIISYPSIRFANNLAHLGDLSYGFPKSFSIPLVNDAVGAVAVELKMEKNGIHPPIEYEMILKSFKEEDFEFDEDPAQFVIEPSKFNLKPKGVQRIHLTMYPNQVGPIVNKLNCWITDENGNTAVSNASVNIRGTVTVPKLQILRNVIHMKDCFVQHQYSDEFVIKNPSELPVIYCIVQKPNSDIKVVADNLVGVAKSWMETKIPVQVSCLRPGEHEAEFDLYSVGSEDMIQTMKLRCDCVPSKVDVSTTEIDFGKIDLLKEHTQTFELINSSPFGFPFTAKIFFDKPEAVKGDIWTVEPEEGELPALDKVTLTVHTTLFEIGFYFCGIEIQMTQPFEHTIYVQAKAVGQGTPLEFSPPLMNQAALNFGTIFAKHERYYEFDIINHSTYSRVLEFKMFGTKPPVNHVEVEDKTKSKLTLNSTKQTARSKFQRKPLKLVDKDDKSKSKVKPVFVITPTRQVIPPKGTAKLEVAAFSSTTKHVDEQWNLWSYVPLTKDDQMAVTGLRAFKKKGPSMKPSTLKKPKKDKEKKPLRMSVPPEFVNLHLKPAIMHELKLSVDIEAPILKYSKKYISMKIEATPTRENFIAEETLKIENMGSLPLNVTLKTKFPFLIYLHKCEYPAEEATYYFEPNKPLTFKIQFDGEHLRKELGSVTFDEQLQIINEDSGTVMDIIELHGEVIFPQLIFSQDYIDFGVITTGMEAVQTISVSNPTPICLTYKWYVKPNSTMVATVQEPAWAQDYIFDHYRPVVMMDRRSRHQSKIKSSNFSVKSESNDSLTQVLHGAKSKYWEGDANEGYGTAQKEKMYRSRMMEFMGLKDNEVEVEDEINYLAYYNQSVCLPRDEYSINEIVDVIPLAGVIQAGQSQLFTFVFYGCSDISFETELVLFVEEGARKTIEVKGATVPPGPYPPSTPEDTTTVEYVKKNESSVTKSSSKFSKKNNEKRMKKWQTYRGE